MPIQTLLGRFVVVRRHRQDAIGAHTLALLRQRNHVPRVVATSAGEYRHAPGGFVHDKLDHADLLTLAERRRLAGGAAGDQPLGAFADLPVDKCLIGGLIDRTVPKRCDKRANRPVKHGRLRISLKISR